MHTSDTSPMVLRGWPEALAVVVGALAAMAAVAALGLWLARADGIPGGGFGSVVAATMLMAMGAPVRLEGSAAFVASGSGGITALPLSVGLAGALVAGALFVRPMGLHAVVPARALSARAAQVAVLWVVGVLLLSWAARHSFAVPTGDPLLDQLGGAVGAQPVVGFRVDPGPAAGWGLLWLAVVLVLALAVSRRTPLPSGLLRFQTAVRPAAHALLTTVLVYAGAALVAGLVEAATGGRARETLAVVFLGLPNLAWLAFGIGLGASWHGHASGSLGLPLPEPLASALHSGRNVTLDIGALAGQDRLAWLLLPAAALALLAAGLGMAMHAPLWLRPWHHAAHLALAMALTMLLVGVVTRISAAFGLSLLGLGGSGAVVLQPDLLTAVPLAAGWGAVAGLVGGAVAGRVRRTAGGRTARRMSPM